MSDDIDSFIQRFQEEMLKQARETYGEDFFRRWQNPILRGGMTDADAASYLKGSCGDSMGIYLKFKNGCVQNASFETDGCAPSIVCGSVAAELSVGKSLEELLDMDAQAIIHKIGKLPQEVEHCAFLAAAAVHSAVDNYMRRQIRADKDRAARENDFKALVPDGVNRSDTGEPDAEDLFSKGDGN